MPIKDLDRHNVFFAARRVRRALRHHRDWLFASNLRTKR